MKRLDTYKIFESSRYKQHEESHALGLKLWHTINNNIGKIEIYTENYIKDLIKQGADINISVRDGYTPLMLCMINEYYNVATLLIKSGADFNFQNPTDGWTAIFYSAYWGKKLGIQFLIKFGADLTIVDVNGENFIDTMSLSLNDWFEKYKTQEMILTKFPSLLKSFKKENIKIHPDMKINYPHIFTGNDLNLLESNSDYNNIDIDKKLSKAFIRDEFEEVQRLINAGASINAKNTLNHTFVMRCSLYKKPEMLKLLIDNRADINMVDDHNRSSVILSAINDTLDCFKILIYAGADLTIIDDNGNNFIDYAYGHIKFWLKYDEGQHAVLSKAPTLYKSFVKNDLKLTPNIQQEFAHLKTANELNLLEANTNSQKPKSNLTPDQLGKILYDVICKNNSTIDKVYYIIKKGANINYNKTTIANFTSLMEAASRGKVEIVELLIKAGADLNSRDQYGRTALILGETRSKTLLIKAGADMNIKDFSGNDFISNRTYNTTLWLIRYETQKLILDTDPTMVSSLVYAGITIDPKIKKEYPHLFTGADLNLL